MATVRHSISVTADSYNKSKNIRQGVRFLHEALEALPGGTVSNLKLTVRPETARRYEGLTLSASVTEEKY